MEHPQPGEYVSSRKNKRRASGGLEAVEGQQEAVDALVDEGVVSIRVILDSTEELGEVGSAVGGSAEAIEGVVESSPEGVGAGVEVGERAESAEEVGDEREQGVEPGQEAVEPVELVQGVWGQKRGA
ncbi:hypothetical protein PTTG_10125 [Puccinia triticina 1-1 BBBD Race 1]|uniref:Uncharacterized protein n=1 Tax=Puccinia triticina (isolate 1-1 / race 1 (BBBD)) TaxID=630390 RepID=A0A180G0P4_PUCT1|nr:hypothetical protein PTTG_10125 [Puccinia triticina 1-1 BBBD Race 1]